TLQFHNPLGLELVNRDNLFVFGDGENRCNYDDGSDAGVGNWVNGVFIRRKSPYTVRAIITYKGNPVSSASVSARIFDATDDPCNIEVDSIERISSTVKFTKNNFPVSHLIEDVKDYNETKIGERTVSYSDLPIL